MANKATCKISKVRELNPFSDCMNNHILVHSHNIYALTVPSKLQQQVFDICQEKHNTWFIDFLTTRSEEENKAYQARLKRVWNCFGNRIHGYNKRIAKQEKYFRFVNHIPFHKFKGIFVENLVFGILMVIYELIVVDYSR